MSDGDQTEFDAARFEATIVRDCLEALETGSPKPSRRISLGALRAGIDSQLAVDCNKPTNGPEMFQDGRDIDVPFATITDEPNMSTVGIWFVIHTARCGGPKPIACTTQRESVVLAEQFGLARITRWRSRCTGVRSATGYRSSTSRFSQLLAMPYCTWLGNRL